MDETFSFVQISAGLAFVGAAFVLYRLLVSQKDAAIEALKEQKETLKIQLQDALERSPDVVVGQFAARAKLMGEEIARMRQDAEGNEEAVKALEAQFEQAIQEMHELHEQVARADEMFGGFLCPNCKAPMEKRIFRSQFAEYGGRDVEIEHEFVTYECGREVDDGDEVKPCGWSEGRGLPTP